MSVTVCLMSLPSCKNRRVKPQRRNDWILTKKTQKSFSFPKKPSGAALLQFLRFGIVGLSNTAVSYTCNILTLKLLEPYALSRDYIAANTVAFLLSVLWSFYWNSRFVFHTEHRGKKMVALTLLKTYIAYSLTGLLLNNILSWLWITKLGISRYLAPLINIVICVPINFLMNKFWAFRK